METLSFNSQSGSKSEIVLAGIPGDNQNGGKINTIRVTESPEEIFELLEDVTIQ